MLFVASADMQVLSTDTNKEKKNGLTPTKPLVSLAVTEQFLVKSLDLVSQEISHQVAVPSRSSHICLHHNMTQNTPSPLETRLK